jgi:hypothetical protein
MYFLQKTVSSTEENHTAFAQNSLRRERERERDKVRVSSWIVGGWFLVPTLKSTGSLFPY